jgi:anti-sigma-K factor RskA
VTTDDPIDPGPDMTAAELALGLLEGDERAAALRRVLADPAFAGEVEQWRERLAGLFDDYRDVAPPDSVAQRLAGERAPVRTRNAWPVLALATALAATIALFFVTRPGPAPIPIAPVAARHPIMLAALMPSDKAATPVSAAIDMTTGEMRVSATALAPAGKTAQLWMIKDGVPHSMGLLRRDSPTRMTIGTDQRAALGAGVTLAVSIEPLGGSPKPTPTGPVVASGALSEA